MTALFTQPSRRLVFVARAARWLLGMVAGLWLLLLACLLVLHAAIVPRIDDLRPWLQERASRALGVPVQLGALGAYSHGLFPTIEARDVALLDAQGQAALVLPRVLATVSPRSLLRLGLEQLVVERPQLRVERHADASLWMAGLKVGAPQDGDDSAALDWLLAQTELVITGGALTWHDALRGAPPLALTEVQLVLRNRGWQHQLRLDATPPPGWGARFTLQAQLRDPLIALHGPAWRSTSGQLYGHFPQVDLAQLGRYADLGPVTLAQGQGALRAWADVQRGRLGGVSADLALQQVDVTLAPNLEPLVLSDVRGRVGGQWSEAESQWFARGLQFTTDDGLRWPGGDLELRYAAANTASPHGELQADGLDLAVLARIGRRIPLQKDMHQLLRRTAPQGVMRQLRASWHGPLDAPQQYQARGRVQDLALGASASAGTVAQPKPQQPGVRGVQLQFDLTQAGGQAQLRVDDGALALPGVFEDPVIAIDQLSAGVRWQIQGGQIEVSSDDLRFANADAQGQARLNWKTGQGGQRLPGVLDLSGSLSRANGARVHRYLPLAVPQEARHYVRDAVRQGRARQARFRVRGALADFPFAGDGPGEFHVEAQVEGVRYDYVPASLLEPDDKPWPALTQLAGTLVFDGAAMQVKNASGRFAGQTKLQAQPLQARIADLEHPVVEVDGQVRGPLADMLALVRGSHIAQLTDGALDQAQASGAAQLDLQLTLPIDRLAQSTVRGSVTLVGNEVRFVPAAPKVSAARGQVQFTEGGFTLAGVQGQALGGPVQLSGGMQTAKDGAPEVQVRASGTASAEGLRAAPELPIVAQLAQHASGSSAYTLALGVRRGQPEITVTTDLQGMALDAPAPLGKAADTRQSVRVSTQLSDAAAAGAQTPLTDLLTVDLDTLGRLQWLRALQGDDARVLAGRLDIGTGTTGPLPARGVQAHAELPAIDVDAWSALLAPPASASAGAAAATPASALGDEARQYLPTTITLQTPRLGTQARQLHDVRLSATREDLLWRAQVQARELQGSVHYQMPDDKTPQGQLVARLQRLEIAQSSSESTDAALDALLNPRQPSHLPGLDIVVEHFTLHGKRLGQLHINAHNHTADNQQREWRLTRFDLSTPEARFSSRGNWALLGSGGAGAQALRRTVLTFTLDIDDAGALLDRLGMDGVLRKGHGKIDGQIGWLGSPLSPDTHSMGGQLHMDVQTGQFLKADPGLARLLGVLSLQSLPRRLTLDFRDIFSEGFAFDFVRGDARVAQGVASTNNLQMKGVNAAVLMEGSADLVHETQNLHVVIVPEINAMTASLVATAINPVIGLGSFLAQAFLRGPLIEAATQEFRIDGSWAAPRVERVARKSGEKGPAGEGQQPQQ